MLHRTVADIATFVEVFSEPIARSVPHIYLSALIFSPLNFLMQKTLPRLLQPRLVSHRSRSWDTLRYKPESLDSNLSRREIRGMACSSGSEHILCVCDDGLLQTWSVFNGDTTAAQLDGFERGQYPKIAFSRSATQFVANLQDHSLQLWDANSGAKIGVLEGHGSPIRSAAFSPDDKIIVAGSDDGEIQLWDASSLRVTHRIKTGHHRAVRSLHFSPDSKRVASGGEDNLIHVWDVLTGLPIGKSFKGHSDWVWSVVHSPDGNQIASGSLDGTVRVWDAQTGRLCFGALKHNETEWVLSASYSPDGVLLASGGNEGNIRIWDSRTGEQLNHLKVGASSERIRQIIFSPSGQTLACRTQHKFHTWKLDAQGVEHKNTTGLLDLNKSEQSSSDTIRGTCTQTIKVGSDSMRNIVAPTDELT